MRWPRGLHRQKSGDCEQHTASEKSPDQEVSPQLASLQLVFQQLTILLIPLDTSPMQLNTGLGPIDRQ